MDMRFYGLGLGDIKRLAYQLAIRNGLHHPFTHESGAASEKWLRGFLKRNQNLSIRKPQGISKARMKGFTPENVKKYFDLLEPQMQNINHNSSRVFNVDGSGITTVQ
ncbi:hypothetical protein JTB14_018016 [Gonioctena quinquepunctata]|nr:hypothetical protein JTB14_018016 [Gonioctena quinquepunctata]